MDVVSVETLTTDRTDPDVLRIALCVEVEIVFISRVVARLPRNYQVTQAIHSQLTSTSGSGENEVSSSSCLLLAWHFCLFRN